MARVRTLYPSNARPKVRPRRRRVGSLARLQRQEPAGPHRGLRCPPGTYFSSRSLRSNLSDLEENAVLDHKVRPRHRAQPHPRHLPASRGRTLLERADQQARHTEDAPSGSQTTPPGAVLSPDGASSRFSQPGPPPARPCVRQGQRPAYVRPSAYAPGEALPSPQQATPPPSQGSPRQQPRTPENPRLSEGTSGRYWAASAGPLRAYRRPSGQSLWNSWTPCPTCGVCVTTTLPRCLNGARDR